MPHGGPAIGPPSAPCRYLYPSRQVRRRTSHGPGHARDRPPPAAARRPAGGQIRRRLPHGRPRRRGRYRTRAGPRPSRPRRARWSPPSADRWTSPRTTCTPAAPPPARRRGAACPPRRRGRTSTSGGTQSANSTSASGPTPPMEAIHLCVRVEGGGPCERQVWVRFGPLQGRGRAPLHRRAPAAQTGPVTDL